MLTLLSYKEKLLKQILLAFKQFTIYSHIGKKQHMTFSLSLFAAVCLCTKAPSSSLFSTAFCDVGMNIKTNFQEVVCDGTFLVFITFLCKFDKQM